MSIQRFRVVLGCTLMAGWLLSGAGCAKQEAASAAPGAATQVASDADEHAGHDHDGHDHDGHDHADHDHADHDHADHDHDDHAHAGHDHSAWWCAEHGVPEGVCGQCNSKLAAEFQNKGDWCDAHDRPDSQCFVCHPDLQAKFAAQYEAKYGKQPPAIE